MQTVQTDSLIQLMQPGEQSLHMFPDRNVRFLQGSGSEGIDIELIEKFPVPLKTLNSKDMLAIMSVFEISPTFNIFSTNGNRSILMVPKGTVGNVRNRYVVFVPAYLYRL